MWINKKKLGLCCFQKSKEMADAPPWIYNCTSGEEWASSGLYCKPQYLSWQPSLLNLVKKLKLKLGIHYWNKACFSTEARKTLVASTFLPMLDYGDLLYMNASVQWFHMLGSVYHSARRFVTGFKMHTHTPRLTGSLCQCRGTKIAQHLYWSPFLVYFHFAIAYAYLICTYYPYLKFGQNSVRWPLATLFPVPRTRCKLNWRWKMRLLSIN